MNDKDTATFTQSFSLEAPGDAPHTEQFWPNAIEDVADETPYRVVTIVDGIRYEKSDTADCIYDDNEESYEQIHVSIRDDKTKILADNCPA